MLFRIRILGVTSLKKKEIVFILLLLVQFSPISLVLFSLSPEGESAVEYNEKYSKCVDESISSTVERRGSKLSADDLKEIRSLAINRCENLYGHLRLRTHNQNMRIFLIS